MEAVKLRNFGAMPAPTWHHLHMNDTSVDIPEGLAAASQVTLEATGAARVDADAATGFDAALTTAQAAWDEAHEGYEYLGNFTDEQAERLGGTALSEYQKRLDAVEASKSLAAAFETGLSGDATAYLRGLAGAARVVSVPAGEAGALAVRIAGLDGHANACALDVVAEDGATLDVVVTVDSPDAGSGVTGSTLRVFAGVGANVTITRVQTLDDTWIDLDDMGLFLANGARIEVRQTVLGAGKTFTGLAGDLRGDGSSANVVTRYLGHGRQELDFNYVLRHHGRKTTCDLYANGVLAGKSSKCLRGTIDLIRGAKGAQGKETDTVLLVDEGVHNRTVPTILCNEDDVMGNHGATIGHIRPEQLFYLASRGLSQEAAEAMFVSAALEEALIEAPDEPTHDAVLRLGKQLVADFEEVCA